METNKIIEGDCIEVLKTFPDNSVDAVITDPPYGLGFMGKEWDTFDRTQFGKAGEEGENDLKVKKNFKILPRIAEGSELQKFTSEWSKECFRVLKAGGHLLSFGATRTNHRMTIAIEDAGFEIRDQISWNYATGFPKNLDISKAIDKKLGAERKVIGIRDLKRGSQIADQTTETSVTGWNKPDYPSIINITEPATEEAKEWEGWGSALKPAHELIVLARKPISEKTIAENVLKHGTGGINIDASRIPMPEKESLKAGHRTSNFHEATGKPELLKKNHSADFDTPFGWESNEKGRYPSNFIHDGSDIILKEFPDVIIKDDTKQQTLFGEIIEERIIHTSRFFYCAKPTKEEKDLGCEELEAKEENLQGLDTRGRTLEREDGTKTLVERWKGKPSSNNHPTVKPVQLMEYLIRMVTPPKGIVLDPFMGSGTTGIACVKLGFQYIGIEKDPEYIKIANTRIAYYQKQTKLEGY